MVKEKEGAAGQETSRDSSKIVITVLFTTHASTARALDAAIRLAKGFDTSIEIIVPEIVPFALELDHPAIDTRTLLSQVCELTNGVPVETAVHLCLGREVEQILSTVLKPDSIVVIGEREPLWLGKYHRISEYLRARGHHVVFTNPRSKHHA
jgi:hypothetical protein